MWDMFKVNNKDTRTTPTPCSIVPIINFEQLNMLRYVLCVFYFEIN